MTWNDNQRDRRYRRRGHPPEVQTAAGAARAPWIADCRTVQRVPPALLHGRGHRDFGHGRRRVETRHQALHSLRELGLLR